ncbi:uncharacterized protein LOC127728091 [Mytilus californianus]|uniref:uncharacterized protein LOC127728091 n=1 Tax=Mytilus californianus TaxID=6549 RepID=UPI0022463427|nr:uncharacterized protein LOC127728091 [Mytilus californianus]
MAKMQFDDNKKQNVISVLFSLEYMVDGISKFTDDEFKQHHIRLVNRLHHLNQPCTGTVSCSILFKDEQNWCRTCSGWRTTILCSHKNRSVIGRQGYDWSKINSSKWPTDSKEVEKCYNPNWCNSLKGANPNPDDVSVLIGKLINCNDVRALLQNSKVDPDRIRRIRNKIVHNVRDVTKVEKEQYCQDMLDLLQTPCVWSYKEAKDAYVKIKIFKEKNYIDIIKDKIIEEHEINTMEDRISSRGLSCYNISIAMVVSVLVLVLAILIPVVYLGFQELAKTQYHIYLVTFMEKLLFGNRLEETIACDNTSLVTRNEWAARLPRKTELLSNPVMNVFIHNTAGHHCEHQTECAQTARVIQNFHMDGNNWDDIAYNFLIGEDGRVYEGRGWNKVGAHTLGWNENSIAFAFMGNFNDRKPKPIALEALRNIISCGIKDGKISPHYTLYGHRDKRPTDSPGNYLYAEIRHFKHFHHKPEKHKQ